MPTTTELSSCDAFLQRFEEKSPIFFQEAQRTVSAQEQLFRELAEPMLKWAQLHLGEGFMDVLIDGYCEFIVDANRSQLRYEQTRKYEHTKYADVYETAYNSEEFMKLYHWGVYITHFVWAHHLRVYEFYRDSFLERLAKGPRPETMLDLGAGSGIWHLLAHQRLPECEIHAVDISAPAVRENREMAQRIYPEAALNYYCDDALTYKLETPADAAVSCLLLEHLETPDRLMANLSENLKPLGYAFVTGALTAAEYDHIFEFRRESELVALAEDAGFRVVELLTASPETTRPTDYFIPRVVAMVLQKRQGDIW